MAFTLLSRRELLEKGLALGVVSLAPGLTPAAIAEEWDEPTPRRPTPETVLGPFYKKGAPETHALGTPGEPGMPLAVSGRVLSTRGETLPEAVVEVWQSDHRGRYDLAEVARQLGLAPARGSRPERVMAFMQRTAMKLRRRRPTR